MADEQVVEGSNGSNSGSDGGTGIEASNDNVQDSGTQNVSEQGSENQDQNVSGDEGEQDEFIKDEDGNEYIPRKAFEARLAKLTAQKHDTGNARDVVLEALRSDPTFKKEFMDSLNIGGESAASSEESNEPSPFETFVAPLPKEHQAFYRGFAGAMASEVESYFKSQLDAFKKEMIDPIKAHIGQEKLNNFAKSNKDFGKYQAKVAELMDSGRAKNVEDAFILASHADRIKQVHNAGAKEEQDRRQKLARAPIAGRGMSGGNQTRGNSKMGLREALEKAGAEMGYTG